jgi:S-disulfanyl-L-cysteine oxidoreductase SoxD
MSTVRLRVGVLAAFAVSAPALAEGPELGQPLTDRDVPFYARYVMPDGTGLPDGRGTAIAGKAVWETQCASCHGPTGRGNAISGAKVVG